MPTSLRALGAQPLPKLKPSKLIESPEPANSMQSALQPVQPTQWELKSEPMKKTAEVYALGCSSAYEQLGFIKEAIGVWGATKGLATAGMKGWAGKGIAGKAGLSGVTGASHGVGNYWHNLASHSPGVAASTVAIPATVAAGTAGYMLGNR